MSHFGKKRTTAEEKAERTERLRAAISQADALVVGAGAGLSASAGFTYSGERFRKHFSDFAEKYGFSDMYSGGFYPYETLEEHWAYWSRHIMVNRYADEEKGVYATLQKIASKKDCFVITTNVDHCFQKAGFDKSRLFYTQGDYGLFQCSVPCHKKTYDNEAAVRKMCESERGMRIPTELVPRCPVCGEPMSMNLRADSTFVEDEGWHEAAERYESFLESRGAFRSGKVLFLELGVGSNTPGIIKYPFWQMTAQNPNAVYACVNLGEALAPAEISEKSICIDSDIGETLSALAG